MVYHKPSEQRPPKNFLLLVINSFRLITDMSLTTAASSPVLMLAVVATAEVVAAATANSYLPPPPTAAECSQTCQQQLALEFLGLCFLLTTFQRFCGMKFSPNAFDVGAIVLSLAISLLRHGWYMSVSPLVVCAAFSFHAHKRSGPTAMTRSRLFFYRCLALMLTAWSHPEKFAHTLGSFCVMLYS